MREEASRKYLARWLAHLYPREWRARYGREFAALLDDTNLTWRDLFGVTAGALRMRLRKGGNYAMQETTPLVRLLDMACRDVPQGYELESSVEFTTHAGNKTLVRSFCRQIDLGDSYVRIDHRSRGTDPAQTYIVFGTKGEVDGDFRTDQTEMLALRADGTVQRTEQTVKTWLKYDAILDRMRIKLRSGMTADEIFRQFRAQS